MVVYDIIIIILIKMVERVITGMVVKCHSTCVLCTARNKEKKVRSACIMGIETISQRGKLGRGR